eukprot:1025279-Amphidinium_carterae.1
MRHTHRDGCSTIARGWSGVRWDVAQGRGLDLAIFVKELGFNPWQACQSGLAGLRASAVSESQIDRLV